MCDINRDFVKRMRMDELELARDALKCGANVHFNNDAALLLSVKNKDLEMITLLLNNGANMNAPRSTWLMASNDGFHTSYCSFESSALINAVYDGYVDAIKILLRHNSNIKPINEFALLSGAHMGHTEIVTLLLENGADVHASDDVALRYSVNRKHIGTVVALLKAGANVNAQDGAPLRSSVTKDNLALVAKLLKYGADIHCCDNVILKNLKKNFNKELADVLLPYCGGEDYHYFPEEYARTKIVAIKSATRV